MREHSRASVDWFHILYQQSISTALERDPVTESPTPTEILSCGGL